MRKNFSVSKTRFGELIDNLMIEKSITARELAAQIPCCDEYIRKVVRGETTSTSPRMLKSLQQILHFNMKEAEKLLAADKIERKFGGIPLELSGKDPEVEPFQRDWKRLTAQQKSFLLMQFKEFIVQNKRHKVHEV